MAENRVVQNRIYLAILISSALLKKKGSKNNIKKYFNESCWSNLVKQLHVLYDFEMNKTQEIFLLIRLKYSNFNNNHSSWTSDMKWKMSPFLFLSKF